jgi:nitrogen fixation/metabolism regulation signal transduction histidine kinase
VQQVGAMKEMVNAFSEYARAPQLQLQALDLNALILEVLDLYRAAGSPVTILERLDPTTPRVEADAGRMRQLLHNVLKNAIEALAEGVGSELHISTECLRKADCRYVELRIEDNGPGFPEDMIGHVFDPYVTSKPKGTGLGLAIVKKIVEEHGGMIIGENVEPHGALIIIRLPTLEGVGTATDNTPAPREAKEEL